MSYILEALKRSEQERTRGVAPTLHAVHVEPFFQRTRFSVWHYGVATSVLALSLLATLHRPSVPGKSDTTGSDTPTLAPLEARRPTPPKPHAPLTTTAPTQPTATNRELPTPPAAKRVHHREKTPSSEPTPIKAKQAQAAPPETSAPSRDAPPPKPQEATDARPPSKHDVIEISQLPAGIQRGMPKLTISGYINNPADPSGNMVGIGDQLVHEGDEVTPGLRLEKIAGNEAIFAYRGYRFRVRLP